MVCEICGCSFESLDSTAVDKELFDSAECEDIYWSEGDDYYEDYEDDYLEEQMALAARDYVAAVHMDTNKPIG